MIRRSRFSIAQRIADHARLHPWTLFHRVRLVRRVRETYGLPIARLAT